MQERSRCKATGINIMFDSIKDLMDNGQWSDAIKEFKAINPTAREYQEYLDEVRSTEDLKNFALLGFYTREYTPDGREY